MSASSSMGTETSLVGLVLVFPCRSTATTRNWSSLSSAETWWWLLSPLVVPLSTVVQLGVPNGRCCSRQLRNPAPPASGETLNETSYSTPGGTPGKGGKATAGAVMSWRTRPELGARSEQKPLHGPAARYWECAFHLYATGLPSAERGIDTRTVRPLGFDASEQVRLARSFAAEVAGSKLAAPAAIRFGEQTNVLVQKLNARIAETVSDLSPDQGQALEAAHREKRPHLGGDKPLEVDEPQTADFTFEGMDDQFGSFAGFSLMRDTFLESRWLEIWFGKDSLWIRTFGGGLVVDASFPDAPRSA